MVVRLGVYLAVFGVLVLIYFAFAYAIFKMINVMWNITIEAIIILVSLPLAYLSIKYIGGNDILKYRKTAITSIPLKKITFTEVSRKVEDAVSSYSNDTFRAEYEDKSIRYIFDNAGVEVKVYLINDQTGGKSKSYAIIEMRLESKGDNDAYIFLKNKISEELGIDSYTAFLEPNTPF